MTDGICFVGLDVHARKMVAAAVQLGSGEVFKGYAARHDASVAATCSATYATTSAGTSVGSAQKRAEKPRRAQLQREPHPVAITTTLGDKTPVESSRRKKNRSSSARDGAPTKRPYAASRPLRASATTTANRSRDSA